MQNYSSSTNCHTGNVPVLEYKGVKFYGGGSFKNMSIWGMDYVIDLAHVAKLNDMWSIPAAWKHTQFKVPTILDWYMPDGSAPPVPGTFWSNLLEDLVEEHAKNVLVVCQGGHGRTGTVLASIAFATGKFTNVDVVEWLRKQYCDEAIERLAQIDYLKGIGVHTTALGSYSFPKVTSLVSHSPPSSGGSSEGSAMTKTTPIRRLGDRCSDCKASEAESLDCQKEVCDFSPSEEWWRKLSKALMDEGIEQHDLNMMPIAEYLKFIKKYSL